MIGRGMVDALGRWIVEAGFTGLRAAAALPERARLAIARMLRR